MALNVSYRHQTKRIKVTPGTTMFEVMENARQFFNLNATAQYELLHRNRTVDLSLPFRLTGISNMATLDLQIATTSSSSNGSAVGRGEPIRVCIQLPDGKRMQHTFEPQDSLEKVLQHFKLSPSPFNYSLNFLQREIVSETFATTTLKELGLMSGSAIFRVQIAFGSSAPAPAPAPEPVPIPVAAAATPSTPTTPQIPTPTPSTVAPSITSTCAPDSQKDLTPAPVIEQQPQRRVQFQEELKEEKDVEMSTVPANDLPMSRGAYEALQLLRNSCFDTVSKTAVLTLMKILTNILSYPEKEKLRSIRLANAAFDRHVGQHPGGRDFLLSSGFVLNEESQCLELNMTADYQNVLTKGLELLEKEANDLQIDPSECPVVVQPKPVDPNFDPFKPQITRMQMQPRGPSATEVLVENLKAKQEQILNAADIPPRNTTVFLTQQQSQQSQQPSWESDDFASSSSSSSDSHLIISSMKARREEMEKAQNFRTQAMRELDELKRRKVFQQTVIRVQFPDRIVLQATFHPNETIQAIMDHLKKCFHPEISQKVEFYLYVTPPTEKLVPCKTLSDSNLVPAALTYLSWTTAPPIPTDGNTIANAACFYLDPKYLEGQTEQAVDYYPKPLALGETKREADEESKASSGSSLSTQGTNAKPKSSGKKPAWLKI